MSIYKKLLKDKIKNTIKYPFYSVYRRRLEKAVRNSESPKHIGIILDGNRRYAQGKGLFKAVEGHAHGADKVHELLRWCYEYDVSVITIWIFSLDNFKRDEEEVDGLFKLIEKRTRTLVADPEIHEKKVRINYIGRTELLPDSLQDAIAQAERETGHYDRLVLNIAIAYGGREEITDAMGRYLKDCEKKGLSLDEISDSVDPGTLEPYLYTVGLPEPDLIIRTSGEIRLSGFLLWQSAYAEYYFSDVLWPEFRKIDFLRALRMYSKRQRRFGK